MPDDRQVARGKVDLVTKFIYQGSSLTVVSKSSVLFRDFPPVLRRHLHTVYSSRRSFQWLLSHAKGTMVLCFPGHIVKGSDGLSSGLVSSLQTPTLDLFLIFHIKYHELLNLFTLFGYWLKSLMQDLLTPTIFLNK